jgi:hypothetical protein
MSDLLLRIFPTMYIYTWDGAQLRNRILRFVGIEAINGSRVNFTHRHTSEVRTTNNARGLISCPLDMQILGIL